MSAQQSPELKFRCSTSESTISAVFFLEPDSKEAHAALSLASSKGSNESVDLVGDVDIPARSATGHVVRVHDVSEPDWLWSVGSDPSSDLVLPEAYSKHATIYQLGYDDDDTHQEFATILARHNDAPIELVDPVGCLENTYSERLNRSRRCLRRLQLLAIGDYKFRVYYPQLTEEEQKTQRTLFRSIMHHEPDREVARRSLLKLEDIEGGAFGTIAKYLNIETGREYVLKTIDTITLMKLNKLRRAVRELEILQKVRSPYVIRSVELENSQTDTELSVLIPFFPRTLKEALKRKSGRPSDVKIHDIMFQVLHGICYLHTEHGTVHRDIKPDNILLYTTDDGRIIAKVSDLGLVVKVVAGYASSSGGGAIRYCCPALLEKKTRPKLRCDAFSFAATYLQALFPDEFGEAWKPFSDFLRNTADWAKALRKIARKHNLQGFEHWIAAALRYDPLERPSCPELLGAMEAFKSNLPIPDVEEQMALNTAEPPEVFENLSEAQAESAFQEIYTHRRKREEGERITAPYKQRAQQLESCTVKLGPPVKRRR